MPNIPNSEYLKIENDTLLVSEIFASIQGEGINCGVPSIFIRMALCNLHCKWCDTDYTWNWIGTRFEHNDNIKYDPKTQIKRLSDGEVFDCVMQYSNKAGSVVLTGGEPLLQQGDAMKRLLKELALQKFKQFSIEVETNGTIFPLSYIDKWVTQYNVSPKLSNSGDAENLRIRPDVIKWHIENEKSWFKFVVSSDDDMQEIIGLMHDIEIPPKRILIMPEGRTNEEQKKRAKEVVDLCIKYGFRFCNRLHTWIWDGKRGI